MKTVDALHKQVCTQAEAIFGVPVKVYREFNIARDSWEWIIFSRLFGYRNRFDIEISADDINEKYALGYLLSQLPEQIMDNHEKNIEHGFKPYFPVERQTLGGVVPKESVFFPEVE